MRRRLGLVVVAAASLAAADLALWGGHVLWRGRVLQSLTAVVEQMDSLEVAVAEDDVWLSRNERLSQGYGRHREYAERLGLRAQRARAHDILVERYNSQVEKTFRRFYVAPLPAPAPPLRKAIGPVP